MMPEEPDHEIRFRVPPPDGSGDAGTGAAMVALYRDLIDTERSVLAHALQLQRRASQLAAELIEVTNVAPLRELIGEFERRLAYWQGRA